tara:strand:- start:28 stop:519 length:492 start_codon:yes stop_codon:yes gene_type:complete
MEIKSERLVLRKPRQRDKPELVYHLNNWNVVKWLSYVPYPYAKQDAEYWLAKVHEEEFNLNIFKEGILVGGMGITLGDQDTYELGYWLGEEFWGNGFITEAGIALLESTSRVIDSSKLTATYMKENEASRNVLEKLNFYSSSEGTKYSASRKKEMPIVLMKHK